MQDEIPSKTQKKQAMQEQQALGEALVDLPDSSLASIPMPDALAQAIAEARRITSRPGKRRQLQYIGRLMRDLDPEPLRAGLERLTGRSAAEAAQHRRLEELRGRLLEDDDALTEYAREHPSADLQVLRALIRNARREQKEGRPPRAFRELFRLLRETSAP